MDETAAKYVLFDFEIIALIALLLGVVGCALVRLAKRRQPFPPGDFAPWDLVLLFIPAFVYLSTPMLLVLGAADTGGDARAGEQDAVMGLVANLLYMVFIGGLTYAIVTWIHGHSATELFGLRRMNLARIVLLSVLLGLACFLGCGWMLGEVSQQWLEDVFGELKEQEAVSLVRQGREPLELALTFAVTCVAAPVVEEFLFRGYIHGVVRQFTNPLFSAVVTGALFAVVHGNLPALLPLWSFAIVLALVYERTRCLWVCVGMHAFFNTANVVMLLAFEGEGAS